MTDSTLRFCSCDSLQLPHYTEGKMVFRCIDLNCAALSEAVVPSHPKENIIIHKNNIRQTAQRVETIEPCMIYDSALKHTSHIPCPNTACQSHDRAAWGGKTETGITIQPDVLLTNFMSVDKIMTAICRICGIQFVPART